MQAPSTSIVDSQIDVLCEFSATFYANALTWLTQAFDTHVSESAFTEESKHALLKTLEGPEELFEIKALEYELKLLARRAKN